MSQSEFHLNSTSYHHTNFLKDDAILDDFLQNHFNKAPLQDGDLKETTREPTIMLSCDDMIDIEPEKSTPVEQPEPQEQPEQQSEVSNTTIQLDDVVSECFDPVSTPSRRPSVSTPSRRQSVSASSPVRGIGDEFYKILAKALLNRIMCEDKSIQGYLKDEHNKIILDDAALCELVSLITGCERRKVVIGYRDPLPPDVGCFGFKDTPTYPSVIKDITSIRVYNNDMHITYNDHYNILQDHFCISLTHMIHYNETQ